jgi:hypothetical protein
MTLTISLSPQEEARIRNEAARNGLDASEYARRLIIQSLPVEPGGLPALTDAEWENLLDELAAGSDNLPVLPPEAYTREAIYEGRP